MSLENQAGRPELWDRIVSEIIAAEKLVLYAEAGDFPLKGATLPRLRCENVERTVTSG